MDVRVDVGREFWRGVVGGGGFASVPRWVSAPAVVAGVGECEVRVPGGVVSGLRGVAGELGVGVGSLVLAVHGRVLGVLSGEDEVVTGYVSARGGVVPCRLSGRAGSWRELVGGAVRVESGLWAHRDVPVGVVVQELGLSGPLFEVEFDPAGTAATTTVTPGITGGAGGSGGVGGLVEGSVLRVGVVEEGRGLVVRLWFRTVVMDAEAAERVAGYYVAGLGQLAAGVDSVPGSLVSGGELAFQVQGLAGRRREVPGVRVHELFEGWVRERPGAVAAVCGGRRVSYGELNARANRLARALVARGVGREGVVAVVMERNLDWLAAVLAVFKAGGVYLPVEPHFPAGRIAATLGRAGCGVVLSEAGSTGSLDAALGSLGGVERLLVDDAWAEEHAGHDLDLPVDAGQLAYIYFTSGSTGEPKGAMCEHAGLVNHLFAKIDDLGIGEDSVVAQVAPQCFDISLWQLVSALMVGGRTLLVEQDAVLDVGRFLDTVSAGGVTVLQVVPSYLEALLAGLEQQPQALERLRCVSVTGEALKRELAERWFTARPGVALVNAYGLTETCDDTNHEVMHAVPERVLLGPPVSNVHVYVVDDDLMPVPLGAPGEIVFSGVCVGRGYVNDPERTARAFVPDPHRAGERLYRSGDRGRWHPSGKLEFLGRRDTQVKIRGFRIEIGEIENTLLGVPGVRDGAVVVTDTGAGQQLAAFYTAPTPLDSRMLQEHLAATLPAYMVPPVFHWQQALPLTPNGKTDKKTLTHLATDLATHTPTDSGAAEREAPATATEQRLAAAWANVLGIEQDQIGRQDHFFDRGGTSLSAVKLAIALDRQITLKDVTRHPVLADLATQLDSAAPLPAADSPAGSATGSATELTPAP
ncbi:amino acid adenylation domain-containing protein [Streptomyces sp. NBC_01619]|uniref:non-ribosomal peptide synthetase n=1 Tax=Streptomyces sp. NBC_01619 TaxID=2975901 RepID=UPI002B1CC009|nr:amino acid adenylation domain-containing protein [Streptomyces sp. NBC_01619]